MDIVSWLRRMAEDARLMTTNSYRFDEAADEIERLRRMHRDMCRVAGEQLDQIERLKKNNSHI